jgi:hypothetical protein
MRKEITYLIALLVACAMVLTAGMALAADPPGQPTDDPNKRTEGRIIFWRVQVQSVGMGTATVCGCNTATGCANAWVKGGSTCSLSAKPFSGKQFSHWTWKGNPVSDKPQARITVRSPGIVQAIFK